MTQRFERLEAVVKTRKWLAASRFTVADILMSDALRLPNKLGALLAHFEAADAARGQD